MNPLLTEVESQTTKEYEVVLRDYLDGTGEAALERAYELGRRALADGLGVLELARLHHEALLKVSPPAFTRAAWGRTIRGAEKLLVETLTPFEMTHRGFKDTNAALNASEERYRELFENANDIVFTADLEGNFTSVNRAGERLTGYERHELLSMHFTAVVSPEYVEVARRAREMKLSGENETTRYELEILSKDGRRVPLEASTRLVYRGGKPVGVQGIARDITERKQAEQAMHQVNERLEDAIKGIAHALHDEAAQLLASVYLAVAEIANRLPPDQCDLLEPISMPLDHAADQLRRLSHELRPVILDDFGLVPAAEFLAQGVSKRTGLVVTVEGSLENRLAPAVEIAFYRILQEALANVSKHARATYVHVQVRAEGRMVTCTIQDNGRGFDTSALCTDKDKSSCLGLVGIRERVAALNGTFAITSSPGRGTTLKVKIPLDS
jgi:two-component system, NarL family, sensor histidine kinase UhpB